MTKKATTGPSVKVRRAKSKTASIKLKILVEWDADDEAAQTKAVAVIGRVLNGLPPEDAAEIVQQLEAAMRRGKSA